MNVKHFSLALRYEDDVLQLISNHKLSMHIKALWYFCQCKAFPWQMIITIFGLIIFLGFWYWLNQPFNRVKQLGDIGYINIPGLSRAEAVARWKRLKKIGQIPPVYPNGWYCIAESHDLKISAVKSIVAFGQNLVLFRGDDKIAHLLDAYCPHMGANLAVGGNVVRGSCIQCPFHGWTFRGEDGQCVDIPYSLNKIPENAKIKKWITEEKNRHIYVWYHCDNIEPTWYLPEIEGVENGQWTYRGRSEHYINAHIQEIPENGADMSHLNILHRPALFKGSDLSKIDLSSTGDKTIHEWEGTWHQEEDTKHIGVLTLKHKLKFFDFEIPFASVNVKARQIGPGVVYLFFDAGLFGKGVLFHHVTPEGPLLQKLQHNLYFGWRMPTLAGKFLILAEALQIERDIMIWCNKKYLRNPLLMKEDALIARHRRFYSQFYTENSLTLEDALKANSENDW